MSEKKIDIYADVARFYADKHEESYEEKDEEKNNGYMKVAKAIFQAKLIFYKYPDEDITFERFINSRYDLSDKILRNDSEENFIYRKNSEKIFYKHTEDNKDSYCKKNESTYRRYKKTEISDPNGKQYFVEDSVDDDVFAWLLLSQLRRTRQLEKWSTVEIYNDINIDDSRFESWFINACVPDSNGEFQMSQKWHLFEYLLYSEMNNEYKFSSMSGDLVGKTSHKGLWHWMADQAGVIYNESEQIKKELKQEIMKKVKEQV